MIKQQGRNYFSLLKMPYLLEEFRLDIKNEDSNVLQFWPIGGETEVEIVFSTKNHFVCCSEVIQRTAIEIL